MKKLVLALVCALALLAPVSVAAPAQAAEAYVTKVEFKKVTKGMSITRVHKILDTKGKQSWVGFGYQSREYKTGSQFGFVMIDYKKRNGVWRLDAKTAFWG